MTAGELALPMAILVVGVCAKTGERLIGNEIKKINNATIAFDPKEELLPKEDFRGSRQRELNNFTSVSLRLNLKRPVL